MKYVYLLQSQSDPNQRHVGSSAGFERRLKEHNAGHSPHMTKLRSWAPVVVIRFEDDEKADRFERYLKSGSGDACANRHLW